MYSALGVVLQWSGRDNEAAEQARKAIALDPFHSQAHLVLAPAYEQLGRYDEAIVEHLETDTLDGIDPSAVAGFKRAYELRYQRLSAKKAGVGETASTNW